MKKTVFFLFFLLPLLGLAQNKELPFPRDEQGKVKFTEVVKVDSTVSAKTLYNNAKVWLAGIFKDSKEVIQVDDQEGTKIVGKGVIFYSVKSGLFIYEEKLQITFLLQCKDGRYKYEIYNAILKADPKYPSSVDWTIEDFFNEKQWFKSNGKIREMKIPHKEGIEKGIESFVNAMKKAMANNSGSKDDW